MEELIKQAFLQVDVLGPHVQEGHYDLIGPNGDIILPSVWEKVVEPDWAITMTMWPLDKAPPVGPKLPPGMPPMPNKDHLPPGMPPLNRPRPGGINIPPPPPGWHPGGLGGGLGGGIHGPGGGGIPPPPRGPPIVPPGIKIVNAAPPKKKSGGGSSSKQNTSMLNFLSGKPVKKK